MKHMAWRPLTLMEGNPCPQAGILYFWSTQRWLGGEVSLTRLAGGTEFYPPTSYLLMSHFAGIIQLKLTYVSAFPFTLQGTTS